MSSNDRGDEPEVTKPPVPRSRPGRPASSARRATDDTGPRPAVPRRAPNRSASTTTVDPPAVDPALDDTVETERPTVMPPDPLLRAKVADGRANGNGKGHTNGNGNTNGNGHTTGNGNGHGTRSGNGSKANGSTRNGTTPRAKAGSRAGDRGPKSGSAPIDAAAVETAEARAAPASEPRIVGAPPAPAVEPPPVEPTEPVAHAVVEAPPGAVERDLPPPTVATTNAVVDLGAIDDPPVVAAVTPTMPPPSPLASPALDPPTLKSEAAAADTFDMSSQPFVDLPVVGQPDAEASPVANGAASRWSLRKLLSKLPTPRSTPGTELGPPSPAEIDAPAAAGTEPMARTSTSPITSPVPIQPPASISDAPALASPDAAQAFVMPFGLMPEQPPYIRPAPGFPGMCRTGPVELDPSLDPDLPQRAPRLKPAQITALRRRGRPRMRRVTRVVRHVDPWSVFKVALCFSLVLYGVCLTAGVLLWNVAYTTGTIDNVQRFFESFGWDTFRFKGGELYHNAWIAGLFCAIGLTGLIVLAATLFNLITDLVGGIRVTVLEEEVIERDPAERRTLLRRRSRHTTSTVPAHGLREDEESIELYEHLG